MGLSYPPEPWDLHGQAVASTFLVPVRNLDAPPPGTRVVSLLGRAVVTTAFFRYEEPSPLTYDEVMATVLVRQGLRPRVWITHIWVDSPASRDGGRALWAIPKDLAEFTVEPGRTHLGHGLASLALGRLRRLPGRWPLRFRIARERDGRSLVTPVRGRLTLELGKGRWSFDGPLAHLRDRRPLLTVRASRFRLAFGPADPG